jgi:DeoD family purine-nucleoside phosphorylase
MTNAWLTERYLRAPDGTFPHLGVRGGGDVAAVALLSGSPARVDQMAGCLDETRKVGDARGYLVCTGTSDGRPVTVATSGVGSPSMAIAVEELAACGARTFIRVGSCASITERLPVGGIMVATAAVCDEGTSRYYAPPNFPPVASLTVVDALVDAASALEVPVELGMTRSTDSFYQGERLTSIVERWRQLGVLTFEMETSCLFTVAATLGLEAASIVCVGSNLLTGDATYQGHGLDAFAAGQQSMLRVAIAAASSLAART